MKVRIVSEAFAIMPPLEQFIEVCFEERRELFYRNVEHGDVDIGRINSVRDFALFVTLLCAAGELERDIEDQEIKVGFYIYQTLLSKATYSAFRLYIFWSVHVTWESNPQPLRC